jgi:hypothetical protein
MENQQFINVFFGIGMTVVGWFARELWAAVKELKVDLAKLREDLPKDYVAKDDYKEDIREIKRCWQRYLRNWKIRPTNEPAAAFRPVC